MRAKSTARGCYPNELTVGFFSFPEKEINDIRKLFADHVSGERSLVSRQHPRCGITYIRLIVESVFIIN